MVFDTTIDNVVLSEEYGKFQKKNFRTPKMQINFTECVRLSKKNGKLCLAIETDMIINIFRVQIHTII